jgi:flagellar protein FlaG
LTPDTALRQHEAMSQQQQAKVKLLATPDYREGYANSVQVRVNLWDFFLQFGTVNQTAADEVEIRNFQGVYLSPQQAKALTNILTQNITQYERAFGEIKIDPNAQQAGAIN